LVAAVGWPAAYLSNGSFPRIDHLPPSIMTLGTVGLACYTMIFLLGEAALLVLAVISIRDEKVHNRYKSLMLLVLYVFTFRYRRVLPGRFLAETEPITTKGAAAGQEPPRSPDPPATEEEVRTAFALLITRMVPVLRDIEVDRAIVDTALRQVIDSTKTQEPIPPKPEARFRPLE